MDYTRREFIRKSSLTATGVVVGTGLAPLLGCTSEERGGLGVDEPVIDIHQHTDYGGRTHPELIAHQRSMGVNKTILLPAGRPVRTEATHFGESNGLAAGCSGNRVCYELAREHPDLFLFGVNEVPGLPDTVKELETYLDLGAKVIGESKFGLACDSAEMQEIYEVAQTWGVPVLMHWQYERYNHGFDRFDRMLEKYPDVHFIGHSRTWWANIGKELTDQTQHSYPQEAVTPGGWTDQLLVRYPNMHGDLSQMSGLMALTRDEGHAREFLDRHQDQLLFGSDCSDRSPSDPEAICDQGTPILDAIRRLSPNKEVERKILYENAMKLFSI